SAVYQRAKSAAERINPRPAEFYSDLAEIAMRQRRSAEAVRFAQQAVSLDSMSVRALGLLGTNQLREGNFDQGRATLERAFAMDAPSARDRGEFNWGSTAWHELTHTFTLGLSNSRAPRWLSEGLSVLEERRARSAWGAQTTVEFLAAYAGGRIRPVSRLNDGF